MDREHEGCAQSSAPEAGSQGEGDSELQRTGPAWELWCHPEEGKSHQGARGSGQHGVSGRRDLAVVGSPLPTHPRSVTRVCLLHMRSAVQLSRSAGQGHRALLRLVNVAEGRQALS